MSSASGTAAPLLVPRETSHRQTSSSMMGRKRVVDAWVYVVLIGAGLTMAFPLFWMLSTSLRTEPELYILPPPFLPIHWTLDNYRLAFERIPFWGMLWNSLFVAVLVTFGRVLTSTFAGFAFARLRFPGRDKMFLLYLAVLMIPFPVTMVPLYLLMNFVGWTDNLIAIILPPFVSAYTTFLCRQYMLGLPTELEDAARIDGANPFRVYQHVIMPLSGPVIAATTIFSFLTTWNSFIWPLIILNTPDNLTLPIGLTTLATAGINYGGYTPWTILMAAATAAAVPMVAVYLVAQRYFLEGIALTGLKG